MKKDLSPAIKVIFERFGFKRMEYIRDPKTKVLIKCLNPYYTSAKEGKVYRVYRGNKLKQMFEDDIRNKYLTVDISPGNGRKRIKAMVHTLIANNYIPYDDKKPIVHHKNRNRHDNRLLNLERTTSQENAQKREVAKRENKTV